MDSKTNIICLGKEFNSDEDRREYFRKELRTKLPELKKIEGFPIAEDEDIIALSDPPYYTACPNPWINNFIEEWEKLKEQMKVRKKNFHVIDPYASDVSEGKNNPIYMAHNYHTKVPHLAILKYILYYTQPGDIILDGFSGTGMTGVASHVCNKPDRELKHKIEKEWKDFGFGKPEWGIRNSIQGELSPVASFITYNFNSPVNINYFSNQLDQILLDIEKEDGWMYKTKHKNGQFGTINYTIWSDVFVCPNCTNEIIFWNFALDINEMKIKQTYSCYHCKFDLTKEPLERVKVTYYDNLLKKIVSIAKTLPVLINYSFNSKRYEKKPDDYDFDLLKKIGDENYKYWIPSNKIPIGFNTNQPIRSHSIEFYHQLFYDRTIRILSNLFNKITSSQNKNLLLQFTSILARSSKLFKWSKNQAGPLTGTLYIASAVFETSIFNLIKNKKNLIPTISTIADNYSSSIVYCNSTTDLSKINSNSIDYIFTDPPFGGNLMYSELNLLWESWLKVFTNNKHEAIENEFQNKSFNEYTFLMTKCFTEYYRILKYDKWITVEFSNTSAAIWNGIQTSLQRAGFIVANVAALDKKQGSFKAVTTTTAVKQDLIISCYKPSEEFENKFKIESKEVGVWDFLREHLLHLPIQIKNDGKSTSVVERNPKILYDRLITFYIMRGMSVPIDAGDFQTGLKQKFIERDGMYFTLEQAAKYDEIYNKMEGEQFILLLDSIYSESEAVVWLKERLRTKPQTYQDIMPDFRIANRSTRKGELIIELKTILDENFIQEKDGSWRVPNMNEVKDRESLRTKALLREFNNYNNEINNAKTKKLKEVRVEVMREGFKKCWEQKDFKTIVSIADKIPQNILLEDEQLLMYYDIAKDRI